GYPVTRLDHSPQQVCLRIASAVEGELEPRTAVASLVDAEHLANAIAAGEPRARGVDGGLIADDVDADEGGGPKRPLDLVDRPRAQDLAAVDDGDAGAHLAELRKDVA